MFLRLGDFGCSRQQEGRRGYACAARKFGAPLRASTRYLVVDSTITIGQFANFVDFYYEKQ